MKTTIHEMSNTRTNHFGSFSNRKSNYWNKRRRYVSMGYFEAANLVK